MTNERAVRKELKARRANGFTFHDDGTVEYAGHYGLTATVSDMLNAARGKTLPRATVLDATYNDSSHNKPGRTGWAIMTGGLNLLTTSGRTGHVSVTIITDAWTHTVRAGTDGNLTKLYGLALQAKARGQR